MLKRLDAAGASLVATAEMSRSSSPMAARASTRRAACAQSVECRCGAGAALLERAGGAGGIRQCVRCARLLTTGVLGEHSCALLRRDGPEADMGQDPEITAR